ncbi:AP complex, mu/sigma subunit, partial [Sporodiniella umbellata]
MIRFFLVINKSYQTRYARYYNCNLVENASVFEAEVAKKCISRKQSQTLFFKLGELKIVYRIYASLYFVIGCDCEENDFGVLEFIQLCVETLNQTFEKVTELDLVFNLEKVHMIMDELVANGLVLETNQERLSTTQSAPYL